MCFLLLEKTLCKWTECFHDFTFLYHFTFGIWRTLEYLVFACYHGFHDLDYCISIPNAGLVVFYCTYPGWISVRLFSFCSDRPISPIVVHRTITCNCMYVADSETLIPRSVMPSIVRPCFS